MWYLKHSRNEKFKVQRRFPAQTMTKIIIYKVILLIILDKAIEKFVKLVLETLSKDVDELRNNLQWIEGLKVASSIRNALGLFRRKFAAQKMTMIIIYKVILLIILDETIKEIVNFMLEITNEKC